MIVDTSDMAGAAPVWILVDVEELAAFDIVVSKSLNGARRARSRAIRDLMRQTVQGKVRFTWEKP